MHPRMVSPLDMEEEERKQLFNISFPVKSYDVFLSHTWRNKGRWKVCSLLMQCGWWIFGLVWFLAVATAMLLCVSGVLPMPLRRRADTMGFDAECPFGPWVFIANLLAFVVTPIVVPYLPESLFPTCFLDAWTILQRFAFNFSSSCGVQYFSQHLCLPYSLHGDISCGSSQPEVSNRGGCFFPPDEFARLC